MTLGRLDTGMNSYLTPNRCDLGLTPRCVDNICCHVIIVRYIILV